MTRLNGDGRVNAADQRIEKLKGRLQKLNRERKKIHRFAERWDAYAGHHIFANAFPTASVINPTAGVRFKF